MNEIVTSRGQVVVPQWVLKRLKLKPGSVDFIFDAEGRTVMIKADKRRGKRTAKKRRPG